MAFAVQIDFLLLNFYFLINYDGFGKNYLGR